MSVLEQMVYDAIYNHNPVIINPYTYNEGVQFGDISFRHFADIVYYKGNIIGRISDEKLKRKVHDIFYGIEEKLERE